VLQDRDSGGVAGGAGGDNPKSLTVIDQNDEQNAKSIQKQLRSVLHAADERTPVSVQAEIGRGAFGVVYRGIWKNIQVRLTLSWGYVVRGMIDCQGSFRGGFDRRAGRIWQ
jgi:hypothetical protein